MHALAPAPAPAPRRQVFVGTALTCGAATALVGGMVALWMRFREVAINGPDHRWIPEDVSVPMVAANVMLIALVPLCIFAQWAVYSAKRDDQTHAGLALALTGLMGISFINAQAYVLRGHGGVARAGDRRSGVQRRRRLPLPRRPLRRS